MMNLGQVMLQQGKVDHALKFTEDALEMLGKSSTSVRQQNVMKIQQQKASLLLTKGKCFESQGHLQESLLCYEEALKQYTTSNTAAKALIGSNFQQKVILAQEI